MFHSYLSVGKLCVLLLVIAGRPAVAEVDSPDSSVRLTPKSAAAEALSANPDLAAAFAAIDGARGRLIQAGLWNNPELQFAGFTDRPFDNEGERNFTVDFAQRFPIAGRLKGAKEVARVDVAIAMSEARDFARTLIGEVQGAAYRVAALDAAIESRASVILTTSQLVEAAQRRHRAAEVSEADVNLLAVELVRFEQEKRRLELDRAIEAVQLNRLLNRGVDTPILLEVDLASKAFESSRVHEPLTTRPDLVRRRLEADRANAESRLARAETWEDWTAGIAFDRDRQTLTVDGLANSDIEDEDDTLGFSVSVPLPLWNRNQGRIATAQADGLRARALTVALERTVESEVEAGRQRVTILSRVVQEYEKTLVPRSQRNIELLQGGYLQGLVAITTLVQAQQQLADTLLRRVEALGELRQAEVALETAAAASPLLSMNLSVEEDRP